MLARGKDNTITKNRQQVRVLTTCEQTLVSNESIRIRTPNKNIWTPQHDKEHDGTQFL